MMTHLELRAGRLCVGQRVDDLALGTRELGGTLKVLESLSGFALLEQQLRHRGYGDVALRINYDRG